MKVSEVIEQLQKLKDEYGDIETRISKGFGGSDLVEKVYFVSTPWLDCWIELYAKEN